MTGTTDGRNHSKKTIRETKPSAKLATSPALTQPPSSGSDTSWTNVTEEEFPFTSEDDTFNTVAAPTPAEDDVVVDNRTTTTARNRVGLQTEPMMPH